MSKGREYYKGFKDCIEHFERTIQVEIDAISKNNSEETLLKSLDSIIATLYLAKLHLDDSTRVENTLEEVFNSDPGTMFGFKELKLGDKEIEEIFKLLKECDNFE